VVNRSRDDTLAVLRSLQPILEQLVKSGDSLPKALDFMLTFPFPPNVSNAIVGDFVNLGATADLDAPTILSNLLVASAPAPISASGSARRAQPGRKNPLATGQGPARPRITLPGLLPLPCLPVSGILPPGWKPPPGTVFPPKTVLPPGTALSPGCLLPPLTGAVTGQQGPLPGLLNGGLLP
jgi:phospholipid/cholesterol/gamma-HCH transport system substrate-binding protein